MKSIAEIGASKPGSSLAIGGLQLSAFLNGSLGEHGVFIVDFIMDLAGEVR